MVCDATGKSLEGIDSAGAFGSGFALPSGADGGARGRGWGEPVLSRRIRFVSWAKWVEESSSSPADLFRGLIEGMVGVSWTGEIAWSC